MSVRFPACEPCRRGKLACDHTRPICTRCSTRGRADACIYRTQPFRRQRVVDKVVARPTIADASDGPDEQHADRGQRLELEMDVNSSPSRDRSYPNPGFLGSSSHATIFNHFDTLRELRGSASNAPTPATVAVVSPSSYQSTVPNESVELIRRIGATFPLQHMVDLVTFWIATGVNLALAEQFVKGCIGTVTRLIASWQDQEYPKVLSQMLYRNTSSPLVLDETSSYTTFAAQFLDENVRWETLGIFFTAVGRACLDVLHFSPLYENQAQRHRLGKFASEVGDRCLDICVSLDCMSDLQLIFQFENFTLHTHIDGDQSYRSWRALGDVISSLFALGYHEKPVGSSDRVAFVDELRNNIFARIYASDKNLAAFLGRPPRINRRFCSFQIPRTSSAVSPAMTTQYWTQWKSNEKMSYATSARWSALCAVLKEQIMEISQETDIASKEQEASTIASTAEALWTDLPEHFRLTGNLRNVDCSPFQRDFLLGIRLDHLHVYFLLRFLLLRHLAETEDILLNVSQTILSLVVEAIVLKERLVNSGTESDWKVAHYGLPAAGIISLALLREATIVPRGPESKASRTKMLRDLNVLVAHIEFGAVVQEGEPNFALFSRAAETIKRILDALAFGDEVRPTETTVPSVPINQSGNAAGEDWTNWLDVNLWDFEINFWNDLAEHPALSNINTDQIS